MDAHGASRRPAAIIPLEQHRQRSPQPRGTRGVGHDSDDGHPRRIAAEIDPLAERVFCWPILAGEHVVDDRHQIGFPTIRRRKRTPADQRNTQGLKISGRHGAHISVRAGVIGAAGMAFHRERGRTSVVAERQGVSKGGVGHAGNVFQLLLRPGVESSLLLVTLVDRGRERECGRH